MYVGIDNGAKGGIAVLDRRANLVDLMRFNVKPREKLGVLDVRDFLRKYPYAPVWLERPTGARSHLAAVAMSDCFASIRTVLELDDRKYLTVASRTWQSCYWNVGRNGIDSKAEAWRVASQYWKREQFIFPGCRVPHDGCVDAALIAMWGRDE